MPNEGLQLFFQWFIVISEIAIGVFLILGLCTFLSNSYALILQAMFIMTTGLYLSTWWMIFASIALLFGAGESLGLDYYINPKIKKKLQTAKFTKKWYLYND
ncbi:MAG: TQO small subunit DoxD [Oscillospiraceae bacterium]